MRHERRQNDGADPSGNHIPEQQPQPGEHEREREQLTELHADVEGQQGREHVCTGELQGLAQREREPEAVHEPESERQDPAPTCD